jgi:hypothetical protein
MSIPTPESGWTRFWKSETPWDLLSAGAGLGTGGGATYKFFTTDPLVDPNAYTWGWIVGSGVLVAGLSQVGKGVQRYRRESAKNSTHDLAGCLHTMNAVLLGDSDSKTVGLRSTVHVPDGSDLVQALDYVGDQRKKNTQGRRMPVNVGAIGKALREKSISCACRTTDNHEDFVRQMITSYSFSEEQARNLDASTMSWMAVPLKGERDAVAGVLYCDCQERDFFSDERQRLLAFAAVGIAYFVGLRYS